jgi:ribosomal protein S13
MDLLKKNNNKQLQKKYIYELTSKYGIGISLSLYICNLFGIPPYINKNNVSKIIQQNVED